MYSAGLPCQCRLARALCLACALTTPHHCQVHCPSCVLVVGSNPGFSFNCIVPFRAQDVCLRGHACVSCSGARPRVVWTQSPRLGEASNPGPPRRRNPHPALAILAVVDPTAIHRKEDDLLALQAHVLCLSETSAMSHVQTSFARNMAQRGHHTYFGMAVAPHSADASGPHLVRGAAGGVAICTALPSRPSVEPHCPEVWATTRLVESFVRLGSLEIRLISLYGLPSSHDDARTMNQYLHTAVVRRLAASKVPTLVAGDFNVRVQSLPI